MSEREPPQTWMPTAAMTWPASGPHFSVKTLVSSAEVPGGFCSVATRTGLAGLRTSSTATPLLGASGQNRLFPVAQSEKPQWPT
jgi:hypothetical protein